MRILSGPLRAYCAAEGWPARIALFLTGAASVLGFAPFFYWPVYIIAFALFFMRLRHETLKPLAAGQKRRYYRIGWWFGFGFFLASLYWIASAFIARGGIYIALAPFGALLLPAALAIFYGLSASLAARLRHVNPGVHALVFAIIIFIAEWLRGHILSGLPWNLPGYIWEAGAPISQSARLIGIYGLSALTLLLCAALAWVITAADNRRSWASLGLSLAVFGGLWVGGYVRISNAELTYHDDIRFRIVALDIRQADKFSEDQYEGIVTRYLHASAQPSDTPPTHIVWPEGAIPYLGLFDASGLTDGGVQTAIETMLSVDQTLYLGLNRISETPDGRQYFNSLVGLTRQADQLALSSVYDKTKLVPFGEYFPGNEIIAGFNIPSLTAFTTSFAQGEPATQELYGLPVASQLICFEAIFPGFVKRQEKAGPPAEFILTISNDSWFGKSTGPWQHFNQVSYRAIETGLPIVRAASNGPSGIIDPYGRRLNSHAPSEDAIIDISLPKGVAK